jgi:hypothetical protein
MKRFTAYEIALAGLSCAFATLLLTLGIYVPVLLFTGYLLAGIALMMPLAKQSFKGYVLAYLGSVLLTLIFSGFNFIDLLPFIVFFGLHPLVNELQLKTKINVWPAFLIKALWFDLSMLFVWKFLFEMSVGVAWIDRYAVPLIIVGGTLFFLVYDRATYRCREIVNQTVERIIKK